MYQFSYAEVVEDSLQDARGRERQAMARAVELLESGRAKGSRSEEASAGLSYLRKLWMILIEDLANAENDLPKGLKAELISIGLWVTREVGLIETGKSTNFTGLIDVCGIIRDGLK